VGITIGLYAQPDTPVAGLNHDATIAGVNTAAKSPIISETIGGRLAQPYSFNRLSLFFR